MDNDIRKCLHKRKGIKPLDIEEIVFCHNSSTMGIGYEKTWAKRLAQSGIKLTVFGVDTIANDVLMSFRSLAVDFLGMRFDTLQILDPNDFVKFSNRIGIASPLDTVFLGREKELKEIGDCMDSSDCVVVSGSAGVGKTRLALEFARQYAAAHGYKILCFKNNDLQIYDDLLMKTEDSGRYLLLLDDVNCIGQYKTIISQALYSKSESKAFKILCTVRDYARGDVFSLIYNLVSCKLVRVEALSDEDIKKLMTDNLGINNGEYLNQIAKVSKGNPRIAFIAGKIAVEKQSLASIQNLEDVLASYYSAYIGRINASESKEIVSLGIVAFLGAVRLDALDKVNQFFGLAAITKEEFADFCRRLSEKELVDIYKNAVVKISDQCLGDYIVDYVFFKKKARFSLRHFRNWFFKLSEIHNQGT
jgi:hypothetical protein